MGEYYVRHVYFRLSETVTFVSSVETEPKIRVLPDVTSCQLEPAEGPQTSKLRRLMALIAQCWTNRQTLEEAMYSLYQDIISLFLSFCSVDLWTNVQHPFRVTLEGMPANMENVTITIQSTDPSFLKVGLMCLDIFTGISSLMFCLQVFRGEQRAGSESLSLYVKNGRKEEFSILCTALRPVYDAEVRAG